MPIIPNANQYYVKGRYALDSRVTVRAYNDLFKEVTWIKTGDSNTIQVLYNGLICCVTSDSDISLRGAYVFNDTNVSDNLTPLNFSNPSNWHKLCELDELELLNSKVDSLEAYVNSLNISPDINLNDYYTKEEIDSSLEAKANISQLPKFGEVVGMDVPTELLELMVRTAAKLQLYNDESKVASEWIIGSSEGIKIDVDQNALVISPDRTILASKEYVLDQISDLATESFVTNKIAEAQLAGSDIDLSGYATKDDIKEFATEQFVSDMVSNIDIPEVPTAVSQLTNDSKYTTLEEVAKVGYLTSIPSDDTKLDKSVYETDKVTYALKKDIPNIEGLATETFVTEAINSIPKIPTKISAFENDKGYLTNHQDISHLALKTEVPTKVSQLTNDSHFLTTIPSEYITESQLLDQDYVTNSTLTTSLSTKADKSTSYTRTEIDNKLNGINESLTTKVDITTYNSQNTALQSSISSKLDKIPYTTDTLVGVDVGDFKAGDNLKNLSVIEILNKILKVGSYIPEVLPESISLNYSQYTLAAENDSVQLIATILPADTTNKVVTWTCVPSVSNGYVSVSASGLVKVTTGRSESYTATITATTVNNLKATCIITIPAKVAEEKTLADTIKEEQLTMYNINDKGEVVEVPYQLNTYTANTSQTALTGSDSGYFEILDNDNSVISYGYQLTTFEYPDAPETIALPKPITLDDVSIQIFDELSNAWVEVSAVDLVLGTYDDLTNFGINIDNQIFNTHNIYYNPNAGASGTQYRFYILI